MASACATAAPDAKPSSTMIWPRGRFDCCCTSSTVASCSSLMSPSSVISSPSWRCGMPSLSEEALMPDSRPAAGKSRSWLSAPKASNLNTADPGQKRLVRGFDRDAASDDDWARTTAASGVADRVRRSAAMSTTIEEGLTHRDSLLEVEHDVERREAERRDLAREIEAQHERLHTLRATVLEELTKQRRVTMPRWPSGPKINASLVDEDDWWNKMLGRKKAA